ncbi:sulfite exporter TauE/SafE family protein [Helicobacter turcicus]|uniref:Probable membrane transporter protein n=1 Tax=Helicobacter turcicus TaxID=2867412 RepID=A0ABS7JLK4_9HELI|nr:sulfite exporter TauE/SafE family protein [Helicobacter turcicus]MBX7490267.1 sulfite exporter TauE/SafE family protein [Helicobacter turcicus]MBX7545154.1 sulfite exporter TauE/SafE family protein [Helicobacter turcicus]
MELLILEPFYSIALFSIGILTGILAGFFGIGGGAILVPLVIMLGHDIKIAIGISIMQMIFSSVYGSYVNYKHKLLDIKDGIYVGIGGLVGAAFSGFVVDYVASKTLEIVFSLFIVYSFVKLFKASAYGGKKRIGEGVASKLFLVLCGCFVGVFAISLGIGGGMMLAPLLTYYLGYSSKQIIPLSLFFVIFSSISGFASLALHGYASFKEGVIVGIASLIGVRIGIFMLSKIDAKKHKATLLIMYAVVLSIMFKKMFFN